VYDGVARAWRLALGSPDGRILGCGTAMADPRSAADPDLVSEEPVSSSDVGAEVPAAADGSTAIVVGDYATRAEAEEVAARIGDPAVAVGHAGAPAAVAPERFAAALPLDPETDAAAQLEDFRERFPEYTDTSWIAMLGGAGEEGA
jgi:hypothetical protein